VFIVVASIAAMFTHSQQNVHTVLAQTLASYLKIPPEQISAAFPFRVVYCFVSFCVVFALTMLSHRAERAQHLASYLRRLEQDIRQQDAMSVDKIAFTYFDNRDSFYLSMVSWIFTLLLVIPVALLLGGGLLSHWPQALPDARSWVGMNEWFNQT